MTTLLHRVKVLERIVVTFVQYFDFVGRALEYGNPQYKEYAAKHRYFPAAMKKLEAMATELDSLEGEKLFIASVVAHMFSENAIERHLKAFIKYYETREWWLLRERNTGADGEVAHERFYKPAAALFDRWCRGEDMEVRKYPSAVSVYDNIYSRTKDVVIGEEMLGTPTIFIIYYLRRRLLDDGKDSHLVSMAKTYVEKYKSFYLASSMESVVIPKGLPLYGGCIPIGVTEEPEKYNVIVQTSFNVLYDLDPLISADYINENALAVGQYSGVNKRIIRRYAIKYDKEIETKPVGPITDPDPLKPFCEKQSTYRPLRRYDGNCVRGEPSARTQVYNIIAERKIFERMIESHPRELVISYEALMGGPSTGGIADNYTRRLKAAVVELIPDISHLDDLISAIESFSKPLSEELKKMLIEVYMPVPHHMQEFLATFGVNLENMILKFQREYRYCVAELISSGKLLEELLIPLTVAQRKKYVLDLVTDIITATEIILITPPSALENFDVSLKRISAQLLRLKL